MRNNTSKAFTLAEALLTITIIGVVMATMVRSINRISPDKEKILFVKTFHAIEHVIADAINDPTKYDQNYYSDEDIDSTADLHIDFRFDPLKTAKATVNGEIIYSCEHEKATVGKCIKKENAMCYFIASGINTVGEVNCENNNDINMKTSNGVYLGNLVGIYGEDDATMPAGSNDPTIRPVEKDIYYVFHIYADGKLSIPKTHQYVGDRQTTAYNWMNDQTQVK